ncbi:hypothetical protein SNE26_22485 [Mucilaginibacter sp. cycad4]|uniref:hypothetical protein n=1 Tax=Mucilaginibacter sp. cycad4 TaxID=3342096 RepID=UPI002AAAB110|nr:hypothetical protein [Mucilaginibacter gossypii]WPU98786.1 hypothetical protein SNE26_22485 [Mucilaginibacter gossypii]
MPNIKFNYLYRDGGNYKNFNSIVFNNPQSILLPSLEQLIRSKLISIIGFTLINGNYPTFTSAPGITSLTIPFMSLKV